MIKKIKKYIKCKLNFENMFNIECQRTSKSPAEVTI